MARSERAWGGQPRAGRHVELRSGRGVPTAGGDRAPGVWGYGPASVAGSRRPPSSSMDAPLSSSDTVPRRVLASRGRVLRSDTMAAPSHTSGSKSRRYLHSESVHVLRLNDFPGGLRLFLRRGEYFFQRLAMESVL